MDKFYGACEQRDAAVGVRAPVAVLEVAAYRAAYGAELHTYLMLASCEQLYLDQTETFATRQQAIFQACLLGSGFRCRGGIRFIVALYGGDIVRESGLRRVGHIACERLVGLVDLAFAQHLIKTRQGL